MHNKRLLFLAFSLAIVLLLSGCGCVDNANTVSQVNTIDNNRSVDASSFSGYSGRPYTEVNGNEPYFDEDDKNETVAFEIYSKLDSLGRCGVAYANICRELMPTEPRGEIGSVRPSGWHTVRYQGIVEDDYLYNRCHLIAHSLAGENDNNKNLITGTKYLNVEGMLPFENKVVNYVENTGNHVLYRVTPVFHANNLVASGVLMEAYSVEDKGRGIKYCVYCYNVQPGIEIDYATGESKLADNAVLSNKQVNNDIENVTADYVLNTNSKRFHRPDCSSVVDIKEKNKKLFNGSREYLINQGYVPCGVCKP